MRKGYQNKRPELVRQSILVMFFILPVLLLMFVSACRSAESDSELSSDTSRSQSPSKLMPQEPPPAPPVISNSLPDRTPLPTPTLRPEITQLPRQAPEIGNELIIAHDQAALAELKSTDSAQQRPAAAVPICNERMPNAALLNIVTQDYGISGDFAPGDLVMLADYLPYDVTLGYPTEVRQAIVEQLVLLIEDMRSAGLRPQVLSGYRSFTAQAIAWDKWNNLYPDRAAILSAPPGHSEHQLGTVIDFGSPELPDLVGQPGIQFHTYFSNTSEGQWLAAHAHEYGFTLSYTLEAFDTTGFYYEPWHYRYVGETMAGLLREEEATLTEYQLANLPPPCTP